MENLNNKNLRGKTPYTSRVRYARISAHQGNTASITKDDLCLAQVLVDVHLGQTGGIHNINRRLRPYS